MRVNCAPKRISMTRKIKSDLKGSQMPNKWNKNP